MDVAISSSPALEGACPTLRAEEVGPALTAHTTWTVSDLRFGGTSTHGPGASLNDVGHVPALAVLSLPTRVMTEGSAALVRIRRLVAHILAGFSCVLAVF